MRSSKLKKFKVSNLSLGKSAQGIRENSLRNGGKETIAGHLWLIGHREEHLKIDVGSSYQQRKQYLAFMYAS